MSYLKNLVEDYDRAIKGEGMESEKLILWTQSGKEVEKADVYEIPTGTIPILLVVYGFDENYADVIPMSYQWELATEVDLIVKFEHPLRGKWIVELDMMITVPKYILYQAEFAGTLKDFDVVEKAIEEGEIPANRKGIGLNDPVHRRFKNIEAERHRWLFSALLNSLNTKEQNLILIPSLRETIEAEQLLKPAAASKASSSKFSGGVVIYDREKKALKVFFSEDYREKTGRVYIKEGNRKITIYRGKIEDFLLSNASENLFRAFENLEVELEHS